MENEKWLLALICAASLIGGFATSLKLLDGVTPVKASQPAAINREQSPSHNPSESKSGYSEADLGIEHYFYIKQ